MSDDRIAKLEEAVRKIAILLEAVITELKNEAVANQMFEVARDWVTVCRELRAIAAELGKETGEQ